MQLFLPKRLTGALAASVVLGGLFAVPLAGPAAAAPTDDPVVDSGDGWMVSRVAGGLQVSLELDEPLPVRDAAPTLYVDGEPLPAQESADGTRLTASVADASVEDVSYGFGTAQAGGSASGVAEAEAAELTPIEDDPATAGLYDVGRADYDYGTQAVELPDLGVRGEFRAAVYYPEGKDSASPVAVLLHGRHSSCFGTPSNPLRYPCTAAQTEIPSYLGYGYAAENLASHGYVVVSVSANAINSNDNQLSDDFGATARGRLIMDHLHFLESVNEGAPTREVSEDVAGLEGALDLGNVGVMGHSRGGEGAVRAAELNQAEGEPFGITSVLPLAPVDYNRTTLLRTNMLTILPYCDGDVEDLQGQHLVDDAAAADPGSDAMRASVVVMGANHNYFNTNWTPGQYPYAVSDDWSILDRSQTDPVCGTNAPTNLRLTDAEQRSVGVALMNGWFRLTLGGEEQFLPLFDGTGGTAASMGDAALDAEADLPASATSVVNDLAEESTKVRPTGSGTADVCATAAECGLPGAVAAQVPHWAEMRFASHTPGTSVTRYRWTSTSNGLTVDVPAGARDVSTADALSFRMTPDVTVGRTADLQVSVLDGSGATATVTASDHTAGTEAWPGSAPNLDKVILREVRIPVGDLTGVDLGDVRRIRLVGLGASGGAYLRDLAFDSVQAGETASAADLPVLSIVDRYVNEGDSIDTTEVALKLDRRSQTPVTGWFQLNNFSNGTTSEPVHQPFTFPAGTTCVAIEVPVNGNNKVAAAPTSSYIGTVSLVAGAVGYDTGGRLTVREDDAVVDAQGNVLEMAPEPEPISDVCEGENLTATTTVTTAAEETVAYGEPATLVTTVLPDSAEGTPTGTVTYAVGGEVLGSAELGADGAARYDVTGLPVGAHVVEATYSGDASYLGSTSTVAVTVETATPDLAIEALDFPAGRKGRVTVTSSVDGEVTVVAVNRGRKRTATAEVTGGTSTTVRLPGFGKRATGKVKVVAKLRPTDAGYAKVKVRGSARLQ